jgi:5,6,7,8-tetrahydromethanopterin hydro-lyase
MSMYIGEALSGDGNEIAHIDLLIGDKQGPVGTAFANALANQSQGHSNLLAVLTPNLAVKPATVLITSTRSPRPSPTASRPASFPKTSARTW